MSKKITVEFTEEDADDVIKLLRDLLDRIDEDDIVEMDSKHDIKGKKPRGKQNE